MSNTAPFEQQVGAPVPWPFRGKTYRIKPLSARQIGEMQGLLRKHFPHPVDEAVVRMAPYRKQISREDWELRIALAQKEAEPKREVLVETTEKIEEDRGNRKILQRTIKEIGIKQIGGWPPSMDSEESNHFLFGTMLVESLEIILRRHNPEITREEIEEIADAIDSDASVRDSFFAAMNPGEKPERPANMEHGDDADSKSESVNGDGREREANLPRTVAATGPR